MTALKAKNFKADETEKSELQLVNDDFEIESNAEIRRF